MEPEVSLPYSQDPATGPYPELDEYSLYPQNCCCCYYYYYYYYYFL